MNNYSDTGAFGEQIVCEYLVNKGYLIIDRNYIVDNVGEIDIIAAKDGTLHFVEVKTSENTDMFHEKHSLAHFDQNKKNRIVRVMEMYAIKKNITNMRRCVDVAAITVSRETKEARIAYDTNVFTSTI